MPLLSTIGLILVPLQTGKIAIKSIDFGWSEFFGGQNIYLIMKKISILNQLMQNNNLKIYLIIFIF